MIRGEQSPDALRLEVERLQRENAALQGRLRAQEKHQFFQRAPVMLIVTELHEGLPYIVDCNDLFLQTLGYERREVLGRSLLEFMAQESRERLLQGGYRRAMEDRFEDEERILTTRDGGRLDTLLRAIPLHDRERNVTGTLAMYIDITDQKRAVALESARRAAEASSAAKSLFLAHMSHEIRTPVSGLLGISSLLRNSPLEKRELQFAEMIYNAADGLLHLLDEILDLSKIEAGELAIEESDVLLGDLLREVIALFQPQAQTRGVRLRLTVDPSLSGLWIRTDSTRLRQIFVNLISNAVKFTHDGDVLLSADRKGERLRFEIRDEGIGIEPDVAEKIFEPFQQAKAGTARLFGGTGLGLTICRELLELMGGSIEIDPAWTQGACFRVFLPLIPGEPIVPTEHEFLDDSDLRRRFRLLIAEDEPMNRMATECQLLDLGFHVRAVENGRQALEALEDETFDLLLIDCMMPELDGYETVRRLREKERLEGSDRLPAVAVTAHAMKGDRERCLAAGMDDYLAKPFRRGELIDMLDAWLRKTRNSVQKDQESPTLSPKSAPVMSEISPIDVDRLSQLKALGRRTGRDLLGNILRVFRDEYVERIESLSKSLEDGDWKNVESIAHSMKGGCGQFGAVPMMNACAKLEECAETRDPAAKETLATIRAEHRRVLEALSDW